MRWLLLAALLAACGESSVCGNGKIEPGEQCDDGNLVDGDACSSRCLALATIDTYIHFVPFVDRRYPSYSETCIGLGVAQVEITVSGPTTVTQKVDCAFAQIKLSSLPQGSYTVRGMAYDGGGLPISRGLAQTTFVAAGARQDVDLEFPYEDWSGSYTGTYFFSILWGGADTCAGAQPRVTKQRLLMTRDGAPVAGTTDSGDPIDGTRAGACRDGNAPRSQAVVGLPWGPAKLTITGEDGSGEALYRKTYDTFVGAGVANPSLKFDVPSLAPDAGVPDAAPPDGGP